MLFSTPIYIFLFLPISVVGYFVLARWSTARLAQVWLIIASLFFYSYTALETLLVVVCSIGVNFIFGSKLCETDTKFPKRLLLATAIALNVALLGYFKYTNFFLENFNAMTGVEFQLLQLGLPLAISFYTFQQIAFLVDCYHCKAHQRRFLSYCLFVMFFPQLVAGPIVRHQEMMPQFSRERAGLLNWQNLSTGIFVFGIGLFKKVIIADSFATWANAGFKNPEALHFFGAWAASLSYTFQLYFDFSGYTDMAIGAALLFNIRLPINFNSPYKATSIRDFWQRWHVSLSRWLRDYLYIPLGGNRKGTSRTLANLIITFLIGGIWHGAGWTFVAWGALHGAALAVHRMWGTLGFKLPKLVAWLCTFLFINVTWVFFRAESLADATRILKAMLPHNVQTPVIVDQIRQINDSMEFAKYWAIDGPLLTSVHTLLFIVGFPLLVFIMPNSMQLIQFAEYDGPLVFRTNLITAVFLAFLLFMSCMTFVGNVSPSAFLYFNF